MTTAPPAPDRRRARTVLLTLVTFYGVAYAALALTGSSFFIFKSLVVPALAVYALASGAPGRFARDWLPFLAATVLFDALRGAIYTLVEAGYRPVLSHYVITSESWLTGVPAAAVPLQMAFRGDVFDRAMVFVHGTHFLFFLFFGLVVWHARPGAFAHYRRTLLVVMYLGLAGYLLVPTMPPWMAAEAGLVPPMERIAGLVYAYFVPELYGTFDTNPVAAMPSLHAAFPVACALIAWRVFHTPWAVAVGIYAAVQCVSAVYLGEHYVADLVAGALLAAAVEGIAARRSPTGREPGLVAAAGLSVGLVVAAFLVASWTS